MSDFRLKVKESANYFKKNWIEFAKILHKVKSDKLFLQWGYKSIVEYAKKELKIKKETVYKLITSYSYLISENISDFEKNPHPSLDTVYSLNKIKSKIKENNNNDFSINHKEYEKLIHEALENNLSPSTIYNKFDKIKNSSENMIEKQQIKKLKYHIKRAYGIISELNIPQNIHNSFTDILEYIENL